MKSIVKKIVGKNPFAGGRKVVVLALCIVFIVASGCSNSNLVFPENDDCIPELGWSVEIKLKSQENERYVLTEDAEIKSLISKHNVTFYQSFPGAKNPDLLLDYTLRGKGCNKENKENAIKDFLATDKFEDEVREFGIANTCD